MMPQTKPQLTKTFKKVKKLKLKLAALCFLLFIIIILGLFFVSWPSFKQLVLAFTTKSAGDTLTAADWNGLATDFVNQAGDTMTGNLIINPGNVGIGTPNPTNKLHVVDNVAGVFAAVIDNTNANGDTLVARLSGTTATQRIFSAQSGGSPFIDRFVVMANGNVGIGTTGPGAKLEVESNANGSGTGIFIDNLDQHLRLTSFYQAGVDQYSSIQSYNNAGTVAQKLLLNPSGGNVGIGTPNPASRLDLGGGCMTGGICSDVRMKENILPMPVDESYISKLTQLQGVSFEWKNLQDDKRYFGLIAQDVEKVIPEVVTTDAQNQEQKGLSCAGLDAVLIEAIKEQEKRIDTLEARLKTLEVQFP